MKQNIKKILKIFCIIFLVLIALVFASIIIVQTVISFKTPSLERNWSIDQKILASIHFSEDGETVDIKNIRNFDYSAEWKYTAKYYDRTIKIEDIETLYYIIEPFSEHDGPAHTMFSFGFSDGTYLTVSVEIRKEIGEVFELMKWVLNEYEVVYMIGDETDLVQLRANIRKHELYLYPIKANKEDIQDLFVRILKRANKLSKEPEFYHTVTNNCTTNLLDHVDDIRTNDIGWKIQALLPSHSDTVLYDLWLIDTELSLEEARKYYYITDISQQYNGEWDYSHFIRKQRK